MELVSSFDEILVLNTTLIWRKLFTFLFKKNNHYSLILIVGNGNKNFTMINGYFLDKEWEINNFFFISFVSSSFIAGNGNGNQNKLIGSVEIPLSSVPASGLNKWWDLEKSDKKNRGKLHLLLHLSTISQRRKTMAAQHRRYSVLILFCYTYISSAVYLHFIFITYLHYLDYCEFCWPMNYCKMNVNLLNGEMNLLMKPFIFWRNMQFR